MLVSLDLSPATLLVLMVVCIGVFAAVSKIVRNGLCNCKKCSGECKSCHVADNMVSKFDLAVAAPCLSDADNGGNFGKPFDDARGLS